MRLRHRPLPVTQDSEIKSSSHHLVLFILTKCSFIFSPAWPRSTVTAAACIFVSAGPGHWLNVGQLDHWEKAERLHREWLLPQPDLILMGTGWTESLADIKTDIPAQSLWLKWSFKKVLFSCKWQKEPIPISQLCSLDLECPLGLYFEITRGIVKTSNAPNTSLVVTERNVFFLCWKECHVFARVAKLCV